MLKIDYTEPKAVQSIGWAVLIWGDCVGGCRGKERHGDLVDLIRFDLVGALRKRGYEDAGCTADDGLMSTVLGQALGRSEQQYPDALIWQTLHAPDAQPLIVEVGRTDMGKWPGRTVLHIGFDHAVSIINPAPADEFVWVVAEEAEHLLAM